MTCYGSILRLDRLVRLGRRSSCQGRSTQQQQSSIEVNTHLCNCQGVAEEKSDGGQLKERNAAILVAKRLLVHQQFTAYAKLWERGVD